MHNILRFIRRKRKEIIIAILIIAMIIAMISLLNSLVKSNNIETGTRKSDIYNTSNGTIKSEVSAVTGGTISGEELKQVSNVIEEFVNYCNEGKVEEAYNLLTDDCKEELYPNLDDFKSYYYERLFNGEKRVYTMENWIDDTYMVRFTKDLLATGKAIGESSYLDYITIVTQNGEKKLNINKYIGKEDINKSEEVNNVKIEVLSRKKYMDYEKYDIKVQNNTDGDILLDELLETKTIYVKDSNDIKHYAYNNELVKNDLLIYKKFSKEIQFKYDNPYIKGRKIKSLCFPKIILHYTPENYGGIQSIKVSVKL